jgi:hypothetical protein
VNGRCVDSDGYGLSGDYYLGTNFDQYVNSWVSPVIDNDWGSSSPVGQNDHFSVRWTGQVAPTETGTYTFRVETDDGVRLWVNNQLLIDQWDLGGREQDANINLTAGRRYDIKMEYFENEGDARARLLWKPPSGAFDLIPATQLLPGGCTLATATELPSRTSQITVPSNGCLKLTQYPDWWQYTSHDVTLQSGTGTFPVPATWTDMCTSQKGPITFRSQWQSVPIGQHAANCPVLISLGGNGSPLQIGWF